MHRSLGCSLWSTYQGLTAWRKAQIFVFVFVFFKLFFVSSLSSKPTVISDAEIPQLRIKPFADTQSFWDDDVYSGSAMAESSKEELVQLIKRFGAYLTVKMSNLFSISFQSLVRNSFSFLFFLIILYISRIWWVFRADSRLSLANYA